MPRIRSGEQPSLSTNELIQHIDLLESHNDRPAIAAISGFGGSGKSTLAARIAESLEGVSVVPIDDFIIGKRTERSDDWRTFDRNRLRQDILDNARIDKILRYQRFNSGEWASGMSGSWRNMKVGRIIIVEGCGIIHPDLVSFYDLSAWIECPQDRALASSKQRDSAELALFGSDNTNLLWDDVWGPNDKDYFDKFRPDQMASVLVEQQF